MTILYNYPLATADTVSNFRFRRTFCTKAPIGPNKFVSITPENQA